MWDAAQPMIEFEPAIRALEPNWGQEYSFSRAKYVLERIRERLQAFGLPLKPRN